MATFKRTEGSPFYGDSNFAQVLDNVEVVTEDEYGWDCLTQPTNSDYWSDRDNDPTPFGFGQSEWKLCN